MGDQFAESHQVASWIRDSRRTVVLTGAGVSTESGIPDFRGPEGVWTKNPEAEKTATLQHYLANSEAREEAWRRRLVTSDLPSPAPNRGHEAIVSLERKGHLRLLVTQNIDGLHSDAGTSADKLIEIHGTTREFACLECGDRGPLEMVLERVKADEPDPPCLQCGGVLKTATISFGQNLVADDLGRAEVEAARCDMFLAIGTSLTVYPVALLPQIALQAKAKLVIVNAQETPFDGAAAAVIRRRIGEALPEIVELV